MKKPAGVSKKPSAPKSPQQTPGADSASRREILKAASKKKKVAAKKSPRPKLVPPPRPIDESEKIPFSEVGTENSVAVPPLAVKPITPVVKVRNRSPLPMPEEVAATPGDDDSSD
ncbi:MAG: hypothetical protein JXX14_19170 [Deltaproteobacteria bacterium]|nr:hypothetical protein [Deltaproteobacteria bacterium]